MELNLTKLIETQARSTKERRINTQTWADWAGIKTLNDPELNAMVATMAEWVLDVREGTSPHWLSILGHSGTGKTHVARRLWYWFSSQYRFSMPQSLQYCPRFITWPQLLSEKLRAGQFDEYNDMRRWPLLVLDDIGAERDSTGFSTEQLCGLLNSRERKWTILTSNLSLRDLAKIDTRISSRMIRDGSYVVELNCQDFNTRNI